MTAMARRAGLLPVIVAGAAALLIAMLGATITDLSSWYHSLIQPIWAPPDWLYGVAWTLIFALAALSAVAAWRAAPGRSAEAVVVGLFALNGFFNVLWSLLFFRLHRPDWAFGEVILLWLSIALLIAYCRRFSQLAAALLVPYLAWVTLAGALNWEIIRLNGPFA